jgi:dolichol-phosphate mannosyltransferase
MHPVSVSLIVAALDEGAVIEHVVRETYEVAQRCIGEFEIILVNDGSNDDTGQIMDRLAAELPHTKVLHNERNLGFGASYLRGVEASMLDYVMLVCGDGGVPPSYFPTIIERIGSADIVIPYMSNLREIKTPFRWWVSKLFTAYMNFLTGKRIKYYNGLAVHRRDLVARTPLESTGYAFQGELLLKLLRDGHSYVEVQVAGAEKEHQRSTFIRPRNVTNMFKTCLLLFREARRPPARKQKDLIAMRHG